MTAAVDIDGLLAMADAVDVVPARAKAKGRPPAWGALWTAVDAVVAGSPEAWLKLTGISTREKQRILSASRKHGYKARARRQAPGTHDIYLTKV